MSAAPVAALLPHFQCASSSSFLPVPSSDPLLLAASPVHDSCFACLRSGMPSPLPPERKIPTCSLQIGIIQSWKILRRHGISLFFRRTFLLRHISLRGTLSLRILSSLQSSFAASLLRFLFRSPLLWPLFRSPLLCGPSFAAPLLRPLFCGFPFVVPFSRPPLCDPLSRPLCGSPLLRPPGKGYFWNR